MFHKPNPNIIKLSSKASDIPLITKKTEGVKEKELEDLKGALADIPIDGIISGALASDYQRKRLELKKQREKIGIHIPREGEDYETTVFNEKKKKKRIVIEETENYWKNDRGYFEIKSAKLIEKKQ